MGVGYAPNQQEDNTVSDQAQIRRTDTDLAMPTAAEQAPADQTPAAPTAADLEMPTAADQAPATPAADSPTRRERDFNPDPKSSHASVQAKLQIPSPAPASNRTTLQLPLPLSFRDPTTTEKLFYEISSEKNHVSPNPSHLYSSPSSKSSERHPSQYTRCSNITSVDGSSKINWDCLDVCTDNDEFNTHSRSSCNLGNSVAAAHECKVCNSVEEEENHVASTELIKKEFQIMNNFVDHDTTIVKVRISYESRFLELKEKLVTSGYDDYALDAIIEVFTTGVKLSGLNSIDKVDSVQCSQAVRRNVTEGSNTRFVELEIPMASLVFCASSVRPSISCGDSLGIKKAYLGAFLQQQQQFKMPFFDNERRQPSLPSVIVISAGFAGFVAARALKNASFQVVVFGSKDRVGGRVYTDYSFGSPVDMGASWLHGVSNENPLAPLIGRLGIPFYRTSNDNSILFDHDIASYALFDNDGNHVPQELVKKVCELFERIVEDANNENKIFDPGTCLLQQSLLQ